MKTLHNTSTSECSVNVHDVSFYGNPDMFVLLCKASSEDDGWMKSTKAMDVGCGCVVQVTTQQRNPDGSYCIAEALTYVPNVMLVEDEHGDPAIVSASGATE